MDGSTYNRYGAECATEAGALPCTFINFHNIYNGDDLYARVTALVDHVFEQCAPEYAAKWQSWLARYRDALICPVNECRSGEAVCHPNGECHDLKIDYECKCKTHYEGDGVTSCTAINYCANVNTCPKHSTCTNLNPGFDCTCNDGYLSVTIKGKKDCKPKDPCKTGNGGCSSNAHCISNIVGYIANHSCQCHAGYQGDGFTCSKINPCDQHNCSAFASCTPFSQVKTAADYNCKCNAGYVGNGFVCAPVVDPCLTVQCGLNGHTKVLTNQYGVKSCVCECDSGYTGNGKICAPKNPCLNNNCDDNATCTTDPVFGYKCTCRNSYTGDGRSCTFVDPCTKCSPYANCNNQKICVCRAAYSGDGFVCSQKTQCEKGCPTGTACQNGSCLCVKSGYKWNAQTYRCDDVNECMSAGKNNCHAYADCLNTNGAFKCSCKQGYKGDGVSCIRQPLVLPTASANPDGLNTDIYTELTPGQCSVMGFEWENMAILSKKMIWSSNVEQNQYFVVQIIGQFQYLGKKAIGRGQPQCDISKAGIVPCNILYFPHLEHRCQAVKRLAKIFADVAQHCNSSWKKLYGDMMNALLQNNTHGKHGASCPAVEWLPAY